MCYPEDTGAPDSDGVVDTDPHDDEDLLAEILERLGECPNDDGNGRIDPATGCIDDVCCGMTRAEIDAVVGQSSRCEPYTPGRMVCYWELREGVAAEFPSALDSGAIDTGDPAAPAEHVLTFALESFVYDRTTVGGSGVDSRMACFTEEFGLPGEVDLAWSDADDAWMLTYASWPFDDIAVWDYSNDGRADLIAICDP